MLLRNISKHVKEQNWFAVALDFFIVVAGILIAFQITNWNEARQAKTRETAVLLQLEEEFSVIRSTLAKQITIRKEYVETIGALITTLEGSGPPANDATIKTALENATNTGRRPAQSAAYLQLMADGGLTTLTNDGLQKALIRYAALLERDEFLHPTLMELVTQEISTNSYRDYNIRNITRNGAAIDTAQDNKQANNVIRSYDLDGLRRFENRYETLYMLHVTIIDSDVRLLGIIDEILSEISKNARH